MTAFHHCEKMPDYILGVAAGKLFLHKNRADELQWDQKYKRERFFIETALRVSVEKKLCAFCKLNLNHVGTDGL